MKLNRKLVLVAALVMSVAMATGGTLAYLTDRDSAANVLTIGNVEIELNEDFAQGSTLIPGVNIEKEASITNTGKNDAWVWLTVLLPEEMGPHTAPDNMSASNNVVHWNYPASSADNIIIDFNETPVQIDTDGDGTNESYYQTNMLWKNILKPGETTGLMLNNVYMDKHVDIDPDGNMYWVDNGVAKDLDWNVNEKGNPVIYVSAYAIQEEGFATVKDAYAAYNEQWGANGTEWGEASTVVYEPEDLNDALVDDKDIILDDDLSISTNDTTENSSYGAAGIVLDNGAVFDGKGNTLSVSDANGTWDCAVNAENGTIKNVTINDAFRGIFMGSATGDVYIDNVVIDKVCYTFNSDGGNKEYGVYISNSTLNGWTSFSDVHKEVVFTNCDFGKGTGGYQYAFCRPYNECVFENCTFAEGFKFDTSKTSAITLINCYYGDNLITAENAETLASGDTTFFYNGLNGITIK